jgi:peptidoglycan hydrolase-like protein with peptidoglycan-binding domain
MPAITETKILNIARSQLGYREGRNNASKYGQWYGLDHAPWCDMFISWVGAQAGAQKVIGRAAYTPSHAAWFQALGRWGRTPRRGAIVFFDFPDSVRRIQHVGIVESVRRDGRIVTIEGNASPGTRGSQSNGNGVYRRVRALNHVVGFGYPHYGKETAVRTIPKHVTKAPNPPLTVDGVWGPNTTRALQRFLGVEVDGKIGPQTRIALQRALGVRADGNWGRGTRKGFQRALGVKADGQWGRQTVRALQRKLNGEWRR